MRTGLAQVLGRPSTVSWSQWCFPRRHVSSDLRHLRISLFRCYADLTGRPSTSALRHVISISRRLESHGVKSNNVRPLHISMVPTACSRFHEDSFRRSHLAKQEAGKSSEWRLIIHLKLGKCSGVLGE